MTGGVVWCHRYNAETYQEALHANLASGEDSDKSDGDDTTSTDGEDDMDGESDGESDCTVCIVVVPKVKTCPLSGVSPGKKKGKGRQKRKPQKAAGSDNAKKAKQPGNRRLDTLVLRGPVFNMSGQFKASGDSLPLMVCATIVRKPGGADAGDALGPTGPGSFATLDFGPVVLSNRRAAAAFHCALRPPVCCCSRAAHALDPCPHPRPASFD